MNKITFLIVVTFFANVLYSQTFMRIAQGTGSTLSAGSAIDSITFTQTFNCGDVILYGGQTYATVQIGSQCWMAQNLNIGILITAPEDQTDNEIIEKYCWRNDEGSCYIYGGYYQWDEVMQYINTPGSRGICPIGWHIPTLNEFQTLSTVVGGLQQTLKALEQPGGGSNWSGFTALVDGYGHPASWINFNVVAYHWSSTELNATAASTMQLDSLNIYINFHNLPKNIGSNVRCLKD